MTSSNVLEKAMVLGGASAVCAGASVIELAYNHEGSNAFIAGCLASAAVGFGLASINCCIRHCLESYRPTGTLSSKGQTNEINL